MSLFQYLLFVNYSLFVLYNRLSRHLASFRERTLIFPHCVVFSFCFAGLVFTGRVPVGCTVAYNIKCTEWGIGFIHLIAQSIIKPFVLQVLVTKSCGIHVFMVQARYGRMFSIDAESGNITTSGDLHFTSTEIKLVILATDRGQNSVSTSTTVTVHAAEVNQHTPLILVQSLDGDSNLRHFQVAENSKADTFIAHVLVSDSDFGSAGRVECFLRAESDDDAQKFRLVPLFPDAAVGEYKLVSGAEFDRENRSVYDISLVCRDFGEPPRWVRRPVVVHVMDEDDNAPIFNANSYNFTIAENNPRGQVIGRVSASDADDGPNASVIYSLASDSESSAWFDVDPSSGLLTARVSFDREFVDHFHFTVFASSGYTSSQVRQYY